MGWEDLLTQALAHRATQAQTSSDSAAAVAAALGASMKDSGVFGTITAGDMLGLDPTQITDVANTRSSVRYHDILSSLGALDFTQKLTGSADKKNLAGALENALVTGAQQHEYKKEQIALEGEQQLKVAKEKEKTPHTYTGADMVAFKRLELLDKKTKGKKLTPIEDEFLRGFKAEDEMSYETAAKILSYGKTATALGIPDYLTKAAADRVKREKPKEEEGLPVGHIQTDAKGRKWKFKGGESTDIKNWEPVK